MSDKQKVLMSDELQTIGITHLCCITVIPDNLSFTLYSFSK